MVLEFGKDAVPAPSPRRKRSELLVCHGLELSGSVLRLGPGCEESGLRDGDTVIGLAVPSAPLTRACAAGLGAPGQGSGPSSGSSTPYKARSYSGSSDHAGVSSTRTESKAGGDEPGSAGWASMGAGAPAPSRPPSVLRCVVAGARTPVATVPVWALWKHPSSSWSSSSSSSGSGSPPARSSNGAGDGGAAASHEASGYEHRHCDTTDGVLPQCLPPPFGGGASALFPGLEVAPAPGESSLRRGAGAAVKSEGHSIIGSPMLRLAGREADGSCRYQSLRTEPERTFLLLRSIRPLLRAQEAVQRCIGCVGRLQTAVVLGADLPGGFEAVQLLAGRGAHVLAVATGVAGRKALVAAWESSGSGTGVTIASTGRPALDRMDDAGAGAGAGASDGHAGVPGPGPVSGPGPRPGPGSGTVGQGQGIEKQEKQREEGDGEGEQVGDHAARRGAPLLEAAAAAGKALEPSALAPPDAAVSALAAALRSVGERPGRVVVGRSVLHPGVTSEDATVGGIGGASERKASDGGDSCDECDPLAALVEALEWTGGVGVDAVLAVSMQPEKEGSEEGGEGGRPSGRSVRPLVVVPPLGEMLGCVCPGGCIALAPPMGRARLDERSGCASTLAEQGYGRSRGREEDEDEDYLDPEDLRLAMRKGVTLAFVDERSLILSGCRVGRLAGMVEQGLRLVASGRVALAPAWGLRVGRE